MAANGFQYGSRMWLPNMGPSMAAAAGANLEVILDSMFGSHKLEARLPGCSGVILAAILNGFYLYFYLLYLGLEWMGYSVLTD